MAKDYYKTLGIDKNASSDEIKSAYRKMAKKYHPDLNKDNEETSHKFKEINEANEVLSNPQKKANYDQYGSADGPSFGGGAGGFGGGFKSGGFSSGGFSGGFEDIFNIFSNFSSGGATQTKQHGEDISVRINLSFLEAALGVEKKILVNRVEACEYCNGTGAKDGKNFYKCTSCNGTGKKEYTQETIFGRMTNVAECKNCRGTGKQVKEKCSYCNGKGYIKKSREITVKIPAGIDNNQIITIRDEGNASKHGGEKGSLKILVHVANHGLLEREGYNLYLTVPVPFTLSLLGGKIKVPGVKEKIEFTIPQLTQTGAVFKLRGKGIKHLRREFYGDLFVTIDIEMPKTLDKKTKKILEEVDEKITNTSYSKYSSYITKLNKK